MFNKQAYRTHPLELSYGQFQKKYNSSLANMKIGSKYSIHRQIGEGYYGKVYYGLNIQTGKPIAAKLSDFKKIDDSDRKKQIKQKIKQLLQREWVIMGTLDCQHIVKIYDLYENQHLKIIIMEYCNSDTLRGQIYREQITETDAIQIFKQLIIGISAMHRIGIIHRDLKSANIMCHNKIYKIVDFGTSRVFPKQDQKATNIGTLSSMAPEILQRKPYGLKADIWSLGTVFYEIIFKQEPYSTLQNGEAARTHIIQQIYNKDLFKNNQFKASKKIINILKLMIEKDPEKRIGWKQLLKTPIFNQRMSSLPELYQTSFRIQYLSDFYTEQKQNIRTVRDQYLSVIQSLEKDTVNNSGKKVFNIHDCKPVKVERTSRNYRDKQIIDNSENPLKQVEAYFIECKKAEWIVDNIISPIQNYKLFSYAQKDRKILQLMYLMICRCFFNLSFIRSDLKSKNNYLMADLKRSVNGLYRMINLRRQFYDKKLRIKQDKLYSMFFDRIKKIVTLDEERIKDLFLTGNQIQYKQQISSDKINLRKKSRQSGRESMRESIGESTSSKTLKYSKSFEDLTMKQQKAGFTKNQQIQYTQTKYINMMLNDAQDYIYIYETKQLLPRYKKIVPCLINYEEISKLKHHDLIGKKWSQKVQEILRSKNQ